MPILVKYSPPNASITNTPSRVVIELSISKWQELIREFKIEKLLILISLLQLVTTRFPYQLSHVDLPCTGMSAVQNKTLMM